MVLLMIKIKRQITQVVLTFFLKNYATYQNLHKKENELHVHASVSELRYFYVFGA